MTLLVFGFKAFAAEMHFSVSHNSVNPHCHSASGGSAVAGDETENALDSGYTRALRIRTVKPHKTEATLAHRHTSSTCKYISTIIFTVFRHRL